VTEDWDGETFTLTLRQTTPPTPGQPLKEPLVIPVAVGLLSPTGEEVVPTTVLELDRPEQAFPSRAWRIGPRPRSCADSRRR
jgi:aminopeptidase N